MKLRKILPLIAVLLLMLVAIPLMVVSASAEEAELTPSEGLTFAYVDKTRTSYSVTGVGDFAGTDLVIPSTYNGLPVTKIGMNAFKNQTQLTSAYIPDSIVVTGHAAFYGCTNLTSVRLSPNMKMIGTNMFQLSGLTDVVVPEGVETIGASAFRASSITSISLPSTLKSINSNAFRACRGLTTIEIPDNVTSMGHACFAQCAKLVTVVLPAGTTQLPNYMFQNARSMKNITFKEGLVKIGSFAFQDNVVLRSVVLPDSLNEIATSAFRGNVRLASIDLGEGVQTIGNLVFYQSALVDVVLPASLKSVGTNAFSGVTTLANVYYAADLDAWNQVTWNNNATIFGRVNRYLYSENDPQAEGYWHYVNGVPTVWEVVVAPSEFTVTFNANGQGTAPEAQTVVAGETATQPEALVATGYVFGGWYTDAACTVAYDFAAAVNADITLYAKWTVITYTVTFNANGQGTAPEAQTVNYGATANKPADLVAAGYVFGGWYTDAACTVAYDFTAAVTADVVVYAKWTATDFTLSADGTYYIVTGFGHEITGVNVVVPANYNNLPVKEIAATAFAGANIDTIVIPASVEVAAGAIAADTTVYFEGAADAWTGDAAKVYFYSESEPITFDTHWHYVDGEVTVWGVPDDVVVGGDPDDGDLEMPEIGI